MGALALNKLKRWISARADTKSLGRDPIHVSGPAVGHGIQIDPSLCATPCKDAGRLILPFVCTNTSANGTHSDQGCT
jgi:hypothetical protein